MTIKIEAFSSPGCGKCAQAKEMLKAIVEELGRERISWRDVNILEEMDYAVELGILSAPAIAIDGELVFPALPSPNRLRAELIRRLGQAR
ncbi:MAG: thioredoxin family protein [Burkholderiales bacterium]|jgi:thioredoxin 1|nr:thioredoxin family protein [Burkholderiales bacterium]PZR65265.1 MAG: glutaredoxin [Stutzerimonas stutzeri]